MCSRDGDGSGEYTAYSENSDVVPLYSEDEAEAAMSGASYLYYATE